VRVFVCTPGCAVTLEAKQNRVKGRFAGATV
jgi:hypothetical protein